MSWQHVLGPKETPPAHMLAFIAEQLRIDSNDFGDYGVSPTKVRKVPEDSCQLPGRKGFSAIPELPRRDLV